MLRAEQVLVFLLAFLPYTQRPALGEVQVFHDRQDWQQAVHHFQTITFTDYPINTNVMALYEPAHGILFTDGWDLVTPASAYENDGIGLRGMGPIHMSFDVPQYWLGVDYPGMLTIRLLWQGEVFFESGDFDFAGSGFFGGVRSDMPFDAAMITRPWKNHIFATAIDDLYFGTACPLATHDQPGLSPCAADIDLDGVVGVNDLVAVIVGWGACPDDAPCAADTDQSCTIDVNDLLEVITNWGACGQ